MCNYTKLGGQVQLDGKTAARYLSVFEADVFGLQAQSMFGRRISYQRICENTRELQFVDSGLCRRCSGECREVKQNRTRLVLFSLNICFFSEIGESNSTTSDGEVSAG